MENILAIPHICAIFQLMMLLKTLQEISDKQVLLYVPADRRGLSPAFCSAIGMSRKQLKP